MISRKRLSANDKLVAAVSENQHCAPEERIGDEFLQTFSKVESLAMKWAKIGRFVAGRKCARLLGRARNGGPHFGGGTDQYGDAARGFSLNLSTQLCRERVCLSSNLFRGRFDWRGTRGRRLGGTLQSFI